MLRAAFRPLPTACLLLGLAACMPAGPTPQPGAPSTAPDSAPTFLEPAALPDASPAERTVEVDLTAGVHEVELFAGKKTQVLAYNGQLPGPTLDVTEGDRVIVHFRNALSQPTTVHWHGLHIPSDQDGNPMDPVAPGASRDYMFDIPAGSAGTYWYHPHTANLTAEQAKRGLAGLIRVKPASDPVPASFRDTVLVLSDNRFGADGQIEPTNDIDRMNGREGDVLFVNGQRQPVLTVRAGEVRRFRVLNASAARYYRLNLPGHVLVQVGTEGGFLERPVERSDLLLAPGERAELLVKMTGQPGDTVSLQSLPYDRGVMPMAMGGMGHGGHMGVSGTETLPLMRLAYSSEPPVQAEPIPAVLRAVAALPTEGALQRSFVLTENMMAMDFRINGQKFDPNRVDVRTTLGSTEIWSVRNDGDMDHPFHLHGTSFQVLDRNGVAEPYRAWKDTVNVRSAETVRFVVRFEDFKGLRMYHCHILEHEDLGMMGQLQVD